LKLKYDIPLRHFACIAFNCKLRHYTWAPSFDTVGWFTRDAATLRTVGDVLLNKCGGDASAVAAGFTRAMIAADAFALW